LEPSVAVEREFSLGARKKQATCEPRSNNIRELGEALAQTFSKSKSARSTQRAAYVNTRNRPVWFFTPVAIISHSKFLDPGSHEIE
jgi:hypothetical protein